MKLSDSMTDKERLEMIRTLSAAICVMSKTSARAVFAEKIFRFSETINHLASMPDSFIKVNQAQIDCDWIDAEKILKGV